ncbi:TetR/AcrR family transcriptional regulator [Herbiconiux moechotypicola]|uniref:HTH tetR-type domain-containing protein n=1 Tax=Herbiconiux moechotypicola TaxID=637393 RepID=A0ABN3D971_9MICO|nr:TetR/AcrR family transcriptional regulator [Herbiconiux moechotypicola]MCS5729103.1 TetR/AcrR family transcriptional regulator [Herbiconiux moechotypicola]
MPKVTEDHRVERRRQIARAALVCFARKGFDATSMADIIAESGLSAGAIYLHYANKHDLVTHVVSDVLRGKADDLAAMIARDPLPAPVEVVKVFVGSIDATMGGPSILVQVWSIAAREPVLSDVVAGFVSELRTLYERYLTAWFERGGSEPAVAAQRAEALVPVVVGICQGYIVQSAIFPGFDPDDYFAALGLIDLAAVPS